MAAKTRRMGWSILPAACLLCWPLAAHADVGIPVGMVFWPAAWILLIPVVLVESIVARSVLRLAPFGSFKLSLKANLWSTLIGVPLACLLMLVVGSVLGSGLRRDSGSNWWADVLFGSAVWLEGLPNWVVYSGPAVLCVPSYFLSVWVEGWSAAKTVPRAEARRWSWIANSISYGLLMVVLATLAILTPRR